MKMPGEFSGRDLRVLDGLWKFQIDQDDLGEHEGWFSTDFDREGWAEVTVPGAWDLYDRALWAYEGIGWYATEIPAATVQPDCWQRLAFSRVNTHARVWLNGQCLGEHVGGFLPFEFVVTPHLRTGGPNVLVVRVDNVPRSEWLPGARVLEWVPYGGILKPVYLLTTATAYVSDLGVVAVPVGTGASASCTVEVTNCRQVELHGQATICVPVGGSLLVRRAEVQCAAMSRTTVSIALEMPDVERWSPESPILYDIFASLEEDGHSLDQAGDRFGVRVVEARGTGIFLNGEPLRIKGVNRYDEYAPYGPTAPDVLVREDLMRVKQAGVNLVRVHYPQAPETLRMMDEIGLLLMEETSLNWWGVPWWGPPSTEHDQAVIAAAEHALEDMIRRDRNHPCIIIWSMANECATDTDTGIRAMRYLLRRARELDHTRLATFVAAGDIEGHAAFDEADLVAVNLYHGLFYGDLAHHVAEMDVAVKAPTEEHLRRMIRQVADRFGKKPLVIAEYGAPGIRGLRGDARFTEDYQAAYIQAAWRAIENVPEVAGGVLWCWADYYHRRDFIGSGGRMLQSPYGPYGVVTVDRKPKQSLGTLSGMYGVNWR